MGGGPRHYSTGECNSAGCFSRCDGVDLRRRGGRGRCYARTSGNRKDTCRMRVLMVVTLISPLGEYGGPLRVAINQSEALVERGHEVTIAGSYSGYPSAPLDIEGIPALLFPASHVIPRSGFAGLAAPRLWTWLMRAAKEFDVAHIHAARDLVTIPAARICAFRGLRYVIQSHGMIDLSSRAMAKPLDAALTVPVLGRAHRVFYLNDRERCDLTAVMQGRDINLTELPNGVPLAEITSTGGHGTEVLFLARLAPRKRPDFFVHAAGVLSGEFPTAKFSLVGPDEGEGGSTLSLIRQLDSDGATINWEGPLPPTETLVRMARAAIYVLPSVDEPYPMSVLEAMSVGLPVIVTESCGLASFVRSARAGLVVNESQTSLIEALRELLAHPEAAQQMGERGRDAVRVRRSMASVASILETGYAVDD